MKKSGFVQRLIKVLFAVSFVALSATMILVVSVTIYMGNSPESWYGTTNLVATVSEGYQIQCADPAFRKLDQNVEVDGLSYQDLSDRYALRLLVEEKKLKMFGVLPVFERDVYISLEEIVITDNLPKDPELHTTVVAFRTGKLYKLMEFRSCNGILYMRLVTPDSELLTGWR